MKRVNIVAVTAALMLGLGTDLNPATFAQSVSEGTLGLVEITFDVPGMTCGTCPITVKAAMSGVDGVQSVEVDLATLSARVVYYPALTDAGAIAFASEQAGYPAAVKG